MPFHFFGPRLSKPVASSQRANRLTNTYDAIQIWEKVKGDYLQGAIVLVANGEKGRGALSGKILGRAGYAGGTNSNRYFAQVNDENGNNHTCISTTGVLDLPAAVVALPTLSAYISCRIVGSSFGLQDTFYPESGEPLGQQVPFRGGRG